MNKVIVEKLVLKKKIKILLNKLLLTILVFLIGLILIKNNSNLKKVIKENIYEKSIKFTKTKSIYEKYFGKYLSMDNINNNEQPVFNEKLSYLKEEKYNNGVKLSVNNNYLVPNLESGIIVFVGEKENIGNSIIIEQIDGIDTMYSNININNYKLYDYIEKGELLGEVKGDNLYISFQKNGEYLDYKKYI